MPWRASHTAAQSPAEPEPQIITSCFLDIVDRILRCEEKLVLNLGDAQAGPQDVKSR